MRKLVTVKSFVLFLLLISTATSYGQINEPRENIVYDYLYRMAQKGMIRWMDIQTPMDRRDIHEALTQLSSNIDLSKREKNELAFYMQEYAFDSVSKEAPEEFIILKKDKST